jgi:hypothetical protein
MPSSFKGQNIFGSGPHRFRVLDQGELILPNSRLNPLEAGSFPVGPLELIVEVAGRLVSGAEAGLWTLRDTIAALLTHPPALATLQDLNGRSWSDMSFTRFATADQTDRGRVFSIAYTAVFIRFL